MNDLNPIMLVDARNLMYRAIFANKNAKRAGNQIIKAHHFTVMVRFMHEWLDKFRPTSVNIYWDAPKKDVWRRNIYPKYKERDDKKYHIDIREDLVFTQAAAKATFSHMGTLQFNKKNMEADDLIYATCRVMFPRPIIIISSDKDFIQIPYRMPNVQVYDPMKNEYLVAEDYDPVIQKALAGDKSDVIDGYEGIGPVKGKKMARCAEEREEYLQENGRGVFIRNLLLVDLALCPHLLKNELYVQKMLVQEPIFDKHKIEAESKQHKLSGLISEYTRIVLPFKLLLERNQK